MKKEDKKENKSEVTQENKKEEIQENVIIREDGVADPILKEKPKPVPEPVIDYDYNDEALKKIEEERTKFLAKYKKANSFKWVVSLGGLAIVILTWILIPQLSVGQSWGTPVIIAIVVVVLGAMLMYSLFTKKTLLSKMKEYFDAFYKGSNNFVFSQEGFDKIELQKPDKINSEQFTDNQMYKDIADVGSRGLTAFEYNNIPVMVCDCAGQIKTDKRLAPVFVGKYFFCASNYDNDDALIIYIKGDQRSLPPTNTEGLKVVFDDNRMSIYSNNSKWKNFINSKAKESLDSIQVNQDLIEVSISFTRGRMFVCMGYDDPLMVLPLDKPFNPNPIKTYKKDIVSVMKFIEVLNK